MTITPADIISVIRYGDHFEPKARVEAMAVIQGLVEENERRLQACHDYADKVERLEEANQELVKAALGVRS